MSKINDFECGGKRKELMFSNFYSIKGGFQDEGV